jgi:hypothetical protein
LVALRAFKVWRDGYSECVKEFVCARYNARRTVDGCTGGNQNGIISSLIPSFAAMRPTSIRSIADSESGNLAPASIAIGLGVLLAGAAFTVVPVVTAMSLVALGANLEAIRRLRNAKSRSPFIAAHLFTYASLYLVFVGAVFHAAMAAGQDGLAFLQKLDLVVSVGPMALAVRKALTALSGVDDIPAR